MVGKTKKTGFPLSKRQNEVWGFILGYLSDNGYPPTRREIATHMDITVPGVQNHLAMMVDKGYLKINERAWRGIEIIQRRR